MARIFTDGAEFGDALFWDVNYAVAVNATARTGSYSYYINNGAGVAYVTKSFTALSELYLRGAVYITAPNEGNTSVLFTLRNGTSTAGYISRSALNRLQAYDGGGNLLATGTIDIGNSEWHVIEWHLKIDGTNGKFDVRVDGINDIAFDGDTLYSTIADVDNLYLISQFGHGFYIDDLALNSTAGGADDSWCDDGRVTLLMPSGNGTTSEWTGSDADKVDNYALVDELPPSSSDYVQDYTAGNQDSYALANFDGTGKTIRRVWAEARALDTVAAGAQIKLGFYINTSDYLSSALTLTGNYARHIGTVYTVNPDDSAAWEDADLDGMELLMETV